MKISKISLILLIIFFYIGISSGEVITYGNENIFNSATTSYSAVATLDDTHFVAVYKDEGNSNYGTAIIGTISGNTITSYGSEYVFNTASTDQIYVTALDSTHFIVTYRNNSLNGTAIIASVSGDTITFGDKSVFNAASTTFTSVAKLDDSYFVISYISATQGNAIIGAYSGTTISSFGSPNVFNTGSTSYTSIAIFDSTHFIVGYKDNGNSFYGTVRVGATSGTTISSYGSESVFNTGITNFAKVITTDSTHFVVSYQDRGNSYYGTARSGVVSGTTVSSYGAESVFNSDYTNSICSSSLDETYFVVGFQDYNVDDGIGIIGSLSGTTISYGSEYIFNNAATHYISTAAFSNTHFVLGYQDGGNSDYGTGLIGSKPAPETPFIPPDPVNIANTSNELWVNYTWSPGSGNITDSFNIGTDTGSGRTWSNGSYVLFSNSTTNGHGFVDIIVYAYNNSASGTLSSGYLSDNVTISNNPITITNTGNWSGDERRIVSVDYNAVDLDSDSPIFSCNRTDLFTNFNTGTGTGYWATQTGDNGTYFVTFGVDDGNGSTDNFTMNITVIAAPIPPGEWVSNETLEHGLGGLSGGWPTPEIFIDNGTLKMIMGESYGIFHGFYWGGNIWVSDSSIISGLPADIGSYSAVTIFNDSGTWKLIAGREAGDFLGYHWSGSTWVSNSSIVSGLGDIGSRSSPEVFNNGGTWKLIAGEFLGAFYGYQWNGTSWVEDVSITLGLVDIGDSSAPDVFNDSGTLKMIIGENQGNFNPYYWNGDSWISDPDNITGLPDDIGSYSTPEVYFYDGSWKMIAGTSLPDYFGYEKSNEALPPGPTPTPTPSPTPTPTPPPDIWNADSDITSGLPDLGDYSFLSPVVFYDGTTRKMIVGTGDAEFTGFRWTGSLWVSDPAVINGLTRGSLEGPPYFMSPTVFNDEGTLKLIVGHGNVLFGKALTGYYWDGDEWIKDLSISDLTLENASYTLPDTPAPFVYEQFDTWYMMIGTNNGTFRKAVWLADTWYLAEYLEPDGLIDVGSQAKPTLFYEDDELKMIVGSVSGGFHGFTFDVGTGEWYEDDELIAGLTDIGRGSSPTVFQGSDWRLISGSRDGDFFGFISSFPEPGPVSTPVRTPIVAVVPTILPTPIVLEFPIPEEAITIFEEIIAYLSTAFSWLFILAAYVGAFAASSILIREIEDFEEIKYDILLFGTLGWIVPLFINFTGLLPLVTESFLLNVIIFAIFGFAIYTMGDAFSKD